MSKAPRAKAIRNTLRERIGIRDVLAHVLISHDDGTVSYKGAHSDHTVAADMPFPCTHNGVEGVRKDLFGKLRPANMPPVVPRDTRLDAIEAQLDAILVVLHRVCEECAIDCPELSS